MERRSGEYLNGVADQVLEHLPQPVLVPSTSQEGSAAAWMRCFLALAWVWRVMANGVG